LPAPRASAAARVNLTLKRVSIETEPDMPVEDLIARIEGLGYEAHELDSAVLAATEVDRKGRDLLMRLAVAFFANMNVMLLSVAVWSGAEGMTRDMFHWISAHDRDPDHRLLGAPILRKRLVRAARRRLNMDVPISLAMILAVALSLWETSLSGKHAYFDAAIMLTFFLLLGRYLDYRTRAAARSAAQELTALEVPKAWKIEDGAERQVRVAEIAPGDVVRVRPGGRVPVDGVVLDGTSEIDRSLMTGESLPAFAGPDTQVHAGEVNLTGPLTLRVTAAGKDTALHRIADLVAVAEAGRANYNSLADRMARLYSPVVHLLALGTFLTWMWVSGGDTRLSLNIAVATLIITCPCALGLAVPAVTTAASGRLFRKGLLIKDGTALERLAEVDTVVFDKTGTLTMGLPEPLDLDALARRDLEVALALAEASSHPLARALAKAGRDRGIRAAPASDLSEVPGYGIEGTVRGQRARLGRAAWVGADGVPETATYLSTGQGAAHPHPLRRQPPPRRGNGGRGPPRHGQAAHPHLRRRRCRRSRLRRPDRHHGGCLRGAPRGQGAHGGRPRRAGPQGAHGGRWTQRHRGSRRCPRLHLSRDRARRCARRLRYRADEPGPLGARRRRPHRRQRAGADQGELPHLGALQRRRRSHRASRLRDPARRCRGHVALLDHRVPQRAPGAVMEVLVWLIPVSLTLGGVGLAAFFWALKARQFEDPEGDSRRILNPDYDDHPKG
jgi:cbb3-type cytochrome oxidase maturation protein